MKKLLPILCLIVSTILTPSCSPSKPDGVVTVEASDAEMNSAIAKARETLPTFWKTFAHPKPNENNFCLKVKITDKNGVEHFWLSDIARTNGAVFGTINNDPDIVHNVKLGERIKISEPDISDWLYERDGKMVGNYTLRVLFKQMPPDEVKKLKSMLADP